MAVLTKTTNKSSSPLIGNYLNYSNKLSIIVKLAYKTTNKTLNTNRIFTIKQEITLQKKS